MSTLSKLHESAAKHHEHAARHHREAAKLHEVKDVLAAVDQAHMAAARSIARAGGATFRLFQLTPSTRRRRRPSGHDRQRQPVPAPRVSRQ